MQQQPQQQRQLNGSQIVAYKRQLFAERYEKGIRDLLFPDDELVSPWLYAAFKSISVSAPYSVQAKVEDYLRLHKMVNDAGEIHFSNLSLFDFAVLSNALETVSCSQLGISHSEYITVLEETVRLVAIWQKMVDELKAKLEKEIEKEVAVKMASEAGKAGIQLAKA